MRATAVSELIADGQLDAAVALLRDLIKAAPDLVGYRVELAHVLERSGDLAGAAEAWQDASLLVPNSQVIADALARLGRPSRGQPDAAGASEEIPPGAETLDSGQSSESGLDLDALISDLSEGRAITEKMDAPAEPVGDSDEDSEELATETLARIFEDQNHLREAVRIYDLLADREENAERAEALRARAADLRRRATHSANR